jgi:hypothetical protein
VTDDTLKVLERLAREGDLSPERVVEEAESKDSPLHGLFEWDDEKAAHAHRLQQARSLIRSVRIEFRVDEHVLHVPRFVHDPDRDEEGGYVETLSVKNDKDKAMRIVHQEVKRAVGCLRRAQEVASVFGLSDKIDSLIDQMMNLKSEVDQS